MALCIKELREKKGMTQSELARVSGAPVRVSGVPSLSRKLA